jgi:phosphoheptose isomerase
MDYFRNVAEVMETIAESPPAHLEKVPGSLFAAWDRGGKVVSFGNGGSATDSLHFTTELVARLKEEPIQRPAVSLSGSPSTLTAVSNDWSFEEVFSRQVESLVTKDDVVIGISTSGNSGNVIRALETADELRAKCYALTGEDGGKMAELDDFTADVIRVPSTRTAHVQEAHGACLHWICEQVDARLNG